VHNIDTQYIQTLFELHKMQGGLTNSLFIYLILMYWGNAYLQ